MRKCTYDPMISTVDVGLTPPPGSVTPLTYAGGVTFELWDDVTLQASLSLRSPEFQDTSAFAARRIFNRTTGGEPIVFAEQSWRRYEVFNLSVITTCGDKQSEILAFLRTVGSNIVRYTDYYSREYDGILRSYSNPTAEHSEDRYTVQLDFIGEPHV